MKVEVDRADQASAEEAGRNRAEAAACAEADMATDLDRELERRGHVFCRYADDCNIDVGSERAGVWLLQSLTGFLAERLKLKVNASKSAVARPWQRKFSGLQSDVAPATEAAHCGVEPGEVDGEGESTVARRAKPKP